MLALIESSLPCALIEAVTSHHPCSHSRRAGDATSPVDVDVDLCSATAALRAATAAQPSSFVSRDFVSLLSTIVLQHTSSHQGCFSSHCRPLSTTTNIDNSFSFSIQKFFLKFEFCSTATNSLPKVPMEGLKVTNANLVVYVHPSKSKEVSQVVLRELSSLLFRFNEVFDGVVLAYDVNSLDKCAKILPGVHPYFGVKLKANLLLFSPKPDMLLEGKVVKLSQESIHVVVLGFSSAIIIDKEIRGDFKFKTKKGQDVYVSKSDKRHVIKVGSMIRFLVKSVDEEILHIYGSLTPDNTGNIHWLDKNMGFISNTDRSAMKRGSESEQIMLEQDNVSGKPSTLDTVQDIRKSKKQKIRAES